MNGELLLFSSFTLFVMSGLMFSKAMEQSEDLCVELNHAGRNRAELEAALHMVKGKDTRYLIAHASQYDLVNLTALQINEPPLDTDER